SHPSGGRSQDGRLWPFPVVPARVADIQGWCCQTFSGSSSLQVKKIVTYTGQQHDALQMCQP
ncbi:hypothetical protein DWH51_12525, partial [Escherichia coli]|nr:hypothetical protein [Escherichia coli]